MRDLVMPFTIPEAAARVGLSAHTLRYYEREGLLPPPSRNQHGVRMFEDSALEWLQLVRCLRDTGMSIAEIRLVGALFM